MATDQKSLVHRSHPEDHSTGLRADISAEIDRIAQRIAESLANQFVERFGAAPSGSPDPDWWAVASLRAVLDADGDRLGAERIKNIVDNHLSELSGHSPSPDSPEETGEGPSPFNLPLPGPWVRVRSRPGPLRLPDPIDD